VGVYVAQKDFQSPFGVFFEGKRLRLLRKAPKEVLKDWVTNGLIKWTDEEPKKEKDDDGEEYTYEITAPIENDVLMMDNIPIEDMPDDKPAKSGAPARTQDLGTGGKPNPPNSART
jgi:hypothetical protein